MYTINATDSSDNWNATKIPGVTFKVKVTKLGAKSYLQPTLATQTKVPCAITFNESGSYAVNIAATKDLQTLESSKTITIRPITRSVIPKIASVQVDGGTLITEFSQPISLGPDATGSLTIHSVLALDAKAVPPSRTLAVLNRTTDQLAGAANGAVVTLSADTARSEGDLKIKLDPTSLVDKPNQLAVIDVWTSEQSSPPQPFVVTRVPTTVVGRSVPPRPGRTSSSRSIRRRGVPGRLQSLRQGRDAGDAPVLLPGCPSGGSDRQSRRQLIQLCGRGHRSTTGCVAARRPIRQPINGG